MTASFFAFAFLATFLDILSYALKLLGAYFFVSPTVSMVAIALFEDHYLTLGSLNHDLIGIIGRYDSCHRLPSRYQPDKDFLAYEFGNELGWGYWLRLHFLSHD